MITEKDRIATCIEKYGLSVEDATRIVKENDDLLNINELRIKYDYPDMGVKYPDWLTPEEHYKMCCSTVKQMYNNNYASICTPEEMSSILYLKSSVKLKQINSHKQLKVGLVTIAMNLYRDNFRRKKYWSDTSLDTPVITNKDDSVVIGYDLIEYKDIEREEKECLNSVLSIKNREVREILILCGYIIGGINSFKSAFDEILNNSDLVDRSKLIELLEMAIHNDKVEQSRIDKTVKKNIGKKHRLNFKSIFNVFKIDMDVNTARLEIGNYLSFTGFVAK